MRRRAWDCEAHAAEIVTAHLGGDIRRVDPGGGSIQLHDFDIVLDDGTAIAVEVTRHNVPSTLAVLAELDKRDWHFGELRYNWVVDMIPTYNVGRIHEEIRDLLATIERAGVETLLLRAPLFDSTLADDELNSEERDTRALLARTGTRVAAERLWRLGARLVYRFTDAHENGGEAIMGEASQASSTGASLVVELIERHAAKPDNAKKLKAATSQSERHLFIWVETSQHAAVAAFGASKILPEGAGIPARPPQLPSAIDAVWVATAYDTAHTWQFHREEGWRDLGEWRRPA